MAVFGALQFPLPCLGAVLVRSARLTRPWSARENQTMQTPREAKRIRDSHEPRSLVLPTGHPLEMLKQWLTHLIRSQKMRRSTIVVGDRGSATD